MALAERSPLNTHNVSNPNVNSPNVNTRFQRSQILDAIDTRIREASEGPPPTVLIVDGSYLARQTIASAIQDLGCDVQVAESSEEGFETAQLLLPDLIILEAFLEDPDGIEMLSRIRRTPTLQNVPVIMLSVHASTRIVGKALTEGANEFLIKPFAMQVLQERVEKCLHQNGGFRGRREERQAG